MIKKIVTFAVLLGVFSSCSTAFAETKVAVVDIQKVVNNSSQIKSLKKEQEAKKKEFAQFIKKAGDEIKKQPDLAKKKALAEKYDKEFAAKQEANAKAYKAKAEAADKNISDSIAKQAKALGYDVVFAKGVVLYGGDDITESVLKIVK